jgi:magnesium transporter
VGAARRYASTDSGDKLTWQELLFGPRPKSQRDPLKEEDIRVQLEEESGSIFQRRSLTAKAALDPRLRCTEVDGNGKVIMVDGELKKSELIAKVCARRGLCAIQPAW